MAILRERCTVVCVNKGSLLSVRLEDPTTHVVYTVPPGGLIEPNEKAEEAAVREVWEETGYRVRVDASSKITGRYPFRWDGKDFDCTTHFFKGFLESESAQPVSDASYHRGVVWVPLEELDQHLNFHPTLYNLIKTLL